MLIKCARERTGCILGWLSNTKAKMKKQYLRVDSRASDFNTRKKSTKESGHAAKGSFLFEQRDGLVNPDLPRTHSSGFGC